MAEGFSFVCILGASRTQRRGEGASWPEKVGKWQPRRLWGRRAGGCGCGHRPPALCGQAQARWLRARVLGLFGVCSLQGRALDLSGPEVWVHQWGMSTWKRRERRAPNQLEEVRGAQGDKACRALLGPGGPSSPRAHAHATPPVGHLARVGSELRVEGDERRDPPPTPLEWCAHCREGSRKRPQLERTTEGQGPHSPPNVAPVQLDPMLWPAAWAWRWVLQPLGVHLASAPAGRPGCGCLGGARPWAGLWVELTRIKGTEVAGRAGEGHLGVPVPPWKALGVDT